MSVYKLGMNISKKDLRDLIHRGQMASGIPLDRLEAICQAERDGRCVVIPKPMTVSDVEMLERIGLIVKNLTDMENFMKTAEANEAAQDALEGGAK